MAKLHFPHHAEFDQVLKKRVGDYFAFNSINPTGSYGQKTTAVGLLVGFIASYLYLLLGNHSWLSALVGTFIFIQFNIMLVFNVTHDAGHQAFSSAKSLNSFALWSMDFLGNSSFLWKQKHNLLHHTYTNVQGKDDDIDMAGLIRLSPAQPYKPWHKFQVFYAPVLYGFLTLYLLFFSDFKRFILRKIGSTPISNIKPTDTALFILFKVFYFTYTLAIPMFFYNPLHVLAYFLFGHIVFGLTLSIVFQLAHTVEQTSFPMPNKEGMLPLSWVNHQLASTCDFAQGNPFVTFYCGGLNYQVEHHLFHKVSHVHYPAISKIVKDTCSEFNVPYLVNKSFFAALVSHFRFLKSMAKAPSLQPCPTT